MCRSIDATRVNPELVDLIAKRDPLAAARMLVYANLEERERWSKLGMDGIAARLLTRYRGANGGWYYFR